MHCSSIAAHTPLGMKRKLFITIFRLKLMMNKIVALHRPSGSYHFPSHCRSLHEPRADCSTATADNSTATHLTVVFYSGLQHFECKRRGRALEPRQGCRHTRCTDLHRDAGARSRDSETRTIRQRGGALLFIGLSFWSRHSIDGVV